MTARFRRFSETAWSLPGVKYGSMRSEMKRSLRSPKSCVCESAFTPACERYSTSFKAKSAAENDSAPTDPTVGTTFDTRNVVGFVPWMRYGRLRLIATSSLIDGTRAVMIDESL